MDYRYYIVYTCTTSTDCILREHYTTRKDPIKNQEDIEGIKKEIEKQYSVRSAWCAENIVIINIINLNFLSQ